MKRMLTAALMAATLVAGMGGAPQAHASFVRTVIDFEQDLDTTELLFEPLLTHEDLLTQSGYRLQPFSSSPRAASGSTLVGALVDGRNPTDICVGILCPNSNSRFLAALDGSAVDLFRGDFGLFRLEKFDVAFVAGIPSTVPGVPLILRTFGVLAGALQYTVDVQTTGLTGGRLNFGTATLPNALSSTLVDEVIFLGLGCDTGGSCRSGINSAQFALDNITVSVPEPETWGLMGLAFIAGLGRRFAQRRASGSAQV